MKTNFFIFLVMLMYSFILY